MAVNRPKQYNVRHLPSDKVIKHVVSLTMFIGTTEPSENNEQIN